MKNEGLSNFSPAKIWLSLMLWLSAAPQSIESLVEIKTSKIHFKHITSFIQHNIYSSYFLPMCFYRHILSPSLHWNLWKSGLENHHTRGSTPRGSSNHYAIITPIVTILYITTTILFYLLLHTKFIASSIWL